VTIEGTGGSLAARLAGVKEPSVTSLNGSIGKTMTRLALSDSLATAAVCLQSLKGRLGKNLPLGIYERLCV